MKSDRSSNSAELNTNTVGVDNLYAEMNDLMHDFEVVSRIADLVSSLKGTYKVCSQQENYLCLIKYVSYVGVGGKWKKNILKYLRLQTKSVKIKFFTWKRE